MSAANCEACWHLWSVHGPSGCHAKVYPSHSLTGEPCPCGPRSPAGQVIVCDCDDWPAGHIHTPRGLQPVEDEEAELVMRVQPPKGTTTAAEGTDSTVTSDGTMPCPVPSDSGLPCVKHIPRGWTADEGHGGGHWWMSRETSQALDRGHYDAGAALAGEPFTIHQPEECTPECPQYPGNWLDRALRRGTKETPNG